MAVDDAPCQVPREPRLPLHSSLVQSPAPTHRLISYMVGNGERRSVVRHDSVIVWGRASAVTYEDGVQATTCSSSKAGKSATVTTTHGRVRR